MSYQGGLDSLLLLYICGVSDKYGLHFVSVEIHNKDYECKYRISVILLEGLYSGIIDIWQEGIEEIEMVAGNEVFIH